MFLFWEEVGNNILSILTIIPKFLYMLLTGILSIVDLLQLFFRSITGLDGVIISGVNGGDPVTGDLAYNIIVEALFGTQFPALKTAFWSMIILGLILLVIATFVANLRIEYRPDKDKGNSRNGIVKNFFRALAYIGIIPLATIFGLYLGNVVLKAIDGATTANMAYTPEQTAGLKAYEMDDGSLTYCAYNILGISIPTKTTPFSSLIFRASAYSCNRVRDSEDFYLAMTTAGTHGKYHDVTDFGVFKKADRESSAEMIDFAFSIGAQLQNPQQINKDAGIVGIGGWVDFWDGQISGNITSFNINNVDLVWYYYSMIKFNWIVAIVAIIMVCKIMLNLCFDMIGRLVEIIMLFLAMPLLHAMMPLDNEEMASKARKRLISKTIIVYAAVFCINLVYCLVPILQGFKFIVIKGVDVAVINYIVNTLILVAALKTVENLIATFSGFIGADYDKDGKLRSSSISAMGEGFNKAVDLATAVGNGALMVGSVAGKVGKGAGWLAGKALTGRHQKLEKLENQRKERDDKYLEDFEKADPDRYKHLYQNFTMGTPEGRKAQEDAKNRLIAKGISAPTKEQIKEETKQSDEYKNYAKSRAYDYVDNASYDALTDEEKAKYATRDAYLSEKQTERANLDARMDRIRNSTRYKMEIPASAVGGFVKKAGKEVGKFGQAVNDKVIKPYIKPVSQEVAHVLSYGLKGASQYGKVVADTTAILDTISPEIKTISEKLKKDNKDGK